MRYRRIYEARCAPIRNQYVAHTDEKTPEELAGMFSVTRIRDFERMLAFLNALHGALWRAYENGVKFNLRLRRSSVRALAREKLVRLGRQSIAEDTVSQTRRALEVYVQGFRTRRS